MYKDRDTKFFYPGVGTVTLRLRLSGVKSELFKTVTCLLGRRCSRVMYPGHWTQGYHYTLGSRILRHRIASRFQAQCQWISQILPFEFYCCSKLNILGQILKVLLTKTFVNTLISPKSILTEKKQIACEKYISQKRAKNSQPSQLW